jgi:hypothetical protein
MAILPKSVPGKEPESQLSTFIPPGLNGYNREPFMGLRRIMQLDGATRIASQIEHDRGAYTRAPIAPVEYGEGNIKKSTAFTGPAGYNHQAIPIADSPDDMSQTDYMVSMRQATGPERLRMRQALALPQQNFLSTQLVRSDEYPLNSSNMMNNLLALASARINGGQQ